MSKPYLVYLPSLEAEIIPVAEHLVAKLKGDLLITTVKPSSEVAYLQLDRYGLGIIYQNQSLSINGLYNDLLLRLRALKSELLIQAISLPKNSNILDITAGFGRDALLMALYGYKITMLENNPLLAGVLSYAIFTGLFPSNMSLIYTNSIDYLESIGEELPLAIYFDPMFESDNRAKAKKPMQFIQAIIQEVESSQRLHLFELAHAKAITKVVVKRENKAPYVNSAIIPSYSKSGKTIRYDIYLISQASNNKLNNKKEIN